MTEENLNQNIDQSAEVVEQAEDLSQGLSDEQIIANMQRRREERLKQVDNSSEDEEESDSDEDTQDEKKKSLENNDDEKSPEDNDEDTENEEESEEEVDKYPVKIKGKTTEVELPKLAEGYAKWEAYQEEVKEFDEKKNKFIEVEEGFKKHIHEAGNEVVKLGQRLLQQLREDTKPDGRYAKETMEDLYKYDPAEWVKRNEELRQQQDALKAAEIWRNAEEERLKTEYQKHINEEAKRNAAILAERLTGGDVKKLDPIFKEVSEYLLNSGNYDIKAEEIDGLYRSSLWEIAYKAMKYDDSLASAKSVAKKIAKAPKLVKPGAAKDSSSQSLAYLEKKATELRSQLNERSGYSNEKAVELYQLNRKINALKRAS